MTQSKHYAVTGGIGSGKSVFMNLLKERGVPVLSCDEIVRELWGEKDFLHGVSELFPALSKGGIPNKSEVARLVFSEEKARHALERYSHPLVMKRLFERAEKFPVCFSEVPLLFEGGFENLFDGVVILQRREEERVRAAAARDGVTEEEIASRARAQIPEEVRRAKRGVVIQNDGSLDDLRAQANRLLSDWGISELLPLTREE